jgi:hypothetical protein
MNKFVIGDFVSSCPHNTRSNFMPGVGEVIAIFKLDKTPTLYVCEHNTNYFLYEEDQIYLYDPY